MRQVITIDIETLPAPEPSNWKSSSPGEYTEEHLKTALNGDFGRILCIGYTQEDDRGNFASGIIGWDQDAERFSLDERQILIEFWNMLHGFRPHTDRIVGHNIFDFDLKFIYKRSIIHGTRPSVDLSFARYRNQPVFDTMSEWERWGYGSKISLHKLARVLGLESSKNDGVNGSRMFEMFREGQYQAIHDYCMRDVELTRAIYRRMTFADCVPAYSSSVMAALLNGAKRTVG